MDFDLFWCTSGVNVRTFIMRKGSGYLLFPFL